MASCLQIKSLLQAYIDGELGSGEKLLFEEHLRVCDACTAETAHARTLTSRLFEFLGADRLRDDLTPGVMAHLPEMVYGKITPLRNLRTSPVPAKRSWLGSSARLIPVFAPILLLIMAGVLWLYWPVPPGTEETVVGMVTYNRGATEVGHIARQGFGNVRVRDMLSEGTVLKTLHGARLHVGLAGPSHVTLYEDAQLQIVNDRELVLDRGRAFVDVGRSRQHFRIATLHGLISVLGTSFHVDVDATGTQVTVVRGEVLVENDTNFAFLTGGHSARFEKGDVPSVRAGVRAERYLEEARSVLPDAVAERFFMTRFFTDAGAYAPVSKQVFMVEAKRRTISALVLNWVPDPYVEGHAGYQVYVSDSALNPLFKASVDAHVFQDKSRSSIRLATPPELRDEAASMLHITLMPDYGTGQLETSFTEVSAIGIRQ